MARHSPPLLLPKPLFPHISISKILLHQLTSNLQVPVLDPQLSNSPLRAPQCLAPYLQKVIPTSSSSSSKPKAPLTRSPPSSIGKEADRRIEIMILRLQYILQELVYQALLDTAAALAQGGGRRREGSPGWGQQGTSLRPTRVRMEEVGGKNWPRNMGVWNWRTRGVLPEITLLLVCPRFLLLLLLYLSLDSHCSFRRFGTHLTPSC